MVEAGGDLRSRRQSQIIMEGPGLTLVRLSFFPLPVASLHLVSIQFQAVHVGVEFCGLVCACVCDQGDLDNGGSGLLSFFYLSGFPHAHARTLSFDLFTLAL